MFVRRMFEYHPVIGFRYIPGVQARCPHESGGYLVRANAQGFRCDHDFETRKRPGTRRVLLFGDSFTAGNGVSNGMTYGALLEKLVPDLEVYNFGLPGTGTDQQYLAYRECARMIEHDLLIVGVLVENIRRVSSPAFYYQRGEDALLPKPYFVLDDGTLVLKNVPVPKEPIREQTLASGEQRNLQRRFPALRRFVTALGLKEVAQRVTRYQPVPEYDSPDSAAWRLMREILTTWIREVPGPVMVVPLPLHQFVERTSSPASYRRRFEELAAGTGCLLHDPLQDLWAHPRKDRRAFRYRDDVHMTRAGHRAVAESLAPAVCRVLG